MRNFIYEYIDKLEKKDIINYCNKNNIKINEYEEEIILYYIKNRYNDFFNNPEVILNEIKDNVSANLYFKVVELYNKYKKYIK